MKLKLIEPLKHLFKDEVRLLGQELGMSDDVIWRQPFPGPGLAVRIIGEVTEKRLDILRKADAVLMEEIRAAGHYRKLWQSFAVLLPIRSVGIMGDQRTYENVIVIRAVTSDDAMTADWAKLPHDLLGRMSGRIINEVRGVNRVVYDISSRRRSESFSDPAAAAVEWKRGWTKRKPALESEGSSSVGAHWRFSGVTVQTAAKRGCARSENVQRHAKRRERIPRDT